MSASTVTTPGVKAMFATSVARLTCAVVTPGSLRRTVSIRPEQVAQVIPPMSSRTDSGGTAKPARATASARRKGETTDASKAMEARSVARFTDASATPSTLPRTRSRRVAQAAQVMPSTARLSRSGGAGSMTVLRSPRFGTVIELPDTGRSTPIAEDRRTSVRWASMVRSFATLRDYSSRAVEGVGLPPPWIAMPQLELHRAHRVGWLRASVMGANDGIVSTASLLIGVAAAEAAHGDVLTAGVAGLVAGAMSMAAGEYVSVSSQADTEKADLEMEAAELLASPVAELKELTRIYIERGLDPDLASRVAVQLTERDALGAHARDELGITDTFAAKPIQAAFSSAAAFAVGGALPLATAALVPIATAIPSVAGTALAALVGLGVTGARLSGARVPRATLRVVFWGVLAMALTAAIGTLFGTVV